MLNERVERPVTGAPRPTYEPFCCPACGATKVLKSNVNHVCMACGAEVSGEEAQRERDRVDARYQDPPYPDPDDQDDQDAYDDDVEEPADERDDVSLRPVVREFAILMERKLRRHDRSRGSTGWRADGWDGWSTGVLARLMDSCRDLTIALLDDNNGDTIEDFATDVANYA